MAASTAVKTNELPGTRAQHRYARMSPYKVREVLDVIRGLPVERADEALQFTERAAAVPIRKLLASAIANAEHNDQLDSETLYVASCYADEGPTLKRWRPRARGRATRIRKRTSHITIVVAPMPPEMLARFESEQAESAGRRRLRRGRAAEARRARVAKSRGEELDTDEHDHEHDDEEIDDETLEALEDEDVDTELDDDEIEDSDDTDEEDDDSDESDDAEKEGK